MLQRFPRVTKSLYSHQLDGQNHWTRPSSSGERLPIKDHAAIQNSNGVFSFASATYLKDERPVSTNDHRCSKTDTC